MDKTSTRRVGFDSGTRLFCESAAVATARSPRSRLNLVRLFSHEVHEDGRAPEGSGMSWYSSRNAQRVQLLRDEQLPMTLVEGRQDRLPANAALRQRVAQHIPGVQAVQRGHTSRLHMIPHRLNVVGQLLLAP